MRRSLATVLAWSLASVGPARADDAEVKAVIDKAVAALGGEAALARVGAFSFRLRDSSLIGNPGSLVETTSKVVARGAGQCRYEYFRGDLILDHDPPHEVMILDGDKNWLKQDGNATTSVGGGMLASLAVSHLLQVASLNLAPLRDKANRVEPAGGEDVDGRPAVGLKVTRPDGLGFTIFFDKAAGLPVRRRGTGGSGETLTGTVHGYQDVGGLKVPTLQRWSSEGGNIRNRTWVTEITDFKALKAVDPATFARPE